MQVITSVSGYNWLVTDSFIQKEGSDNKIPVDGFEISKFICERSQTSIDAEKIMNNLDSGYLRNFKTSEFINFDEHNYHISTYEYPDKYDVSNWYSLGLMHISIENEELKFELEPSDNYGGRVLIHPEHPNIRIEEICTDPGTSYGPYNVVDSNRNTKETIGIGATVNTMDQAKLKAEELMTNGFPEPLPRWSKDGVMNVKTQLGYTMTIKAHHYEIGDDQGETKIATFYDPDGNKIPNCMIRTEDNLGYFLTLRDDPDKLMEATNLKDLRRVNGCKASWDEHCIIADSDKRSGMAVVINADDMGDKTAFTVFDQLCGSRFTYTLFDKIQKGNGDTKIQAWEESNAFLQVFDTETKERVRVALDSPYDIADLSVIERYAGYNSALNDFLDIEDLYFEGRNNETVRGFNKIQESSLDSGSSRVHNVYDQSAFEQKMDSLKEGEMIVWHEPNKGHPLSESGGYETLMVRFDAVPVIRNNNMEMINAPHELAPGAKQDETFTIGKEKCYSVTAQKGVTSYSLTSLDEHQWIFGQYVKNGIDPDKISNSVEKIFSHLPVNPKKQERYLKNELLTEKPLCLDENTERLFLSDRKTLTKPLAESAFSKLYKSNKNRLAGLNHSSGTNHSMEMGQGI